MNRAPATTAGGLLFVLLWSSGYIGADFGLRGISPFTLGVLRFAGSAALIGLWLLWQRPLAPTRAGLLHAALAGACLQAGFFGFIYAAMQAGVSAAASGVIAGLMPLVTAAGAAWFLQEPLGRWTLPGALLGLSGVALVLWPSLDDPGTRLGVFLAAGALLALSGGTLLQRRPQQAPLDPRLALFVQLLVALLMLLPLAAWEGFTARFTLANSLGVLWVTLVNSCCGLLLYLWLLRHGAARVVSGWFYLVPPVTGLLALLVLGERFGSAQWLGFALAAAGVWLAQRPSPLPPHTAATSQENVS
jgi:drug/metabolite transporter (DMT)-like permease